MATATDRTMILAVRGSKMQCMWIFGFVFCTCRQSGLCNPDGCDKMDLSSCPLREAISRVCEAVPGSKGAFRKRKVPSSQLSVYLCLLHFFPLLSPRSIFNHTQLISFSFPWSASCHHFFLFFFFGWAVGNQEESVGFKGVTYGDNVSDNDSCHF